MEQAVVGNPALSFDVMNALSKHGGRCGSISLLRSPVSLFDRICFAHVFALFSLAVKTRAFLVINMCLGVDPHEAVSTAWRRGRADISSGFGFRGTNGRGRRCGR